MSLRYKELNIFAILGKKITIMSSSNKFNNNKTGTIVNETKNMIYLLNGKNISRIKKIAKNEINLVKVFHSNGDYFINGRMLLGRPEEKIFKN
jgi:RNase P/RNase MRP subunit p29